VLGRAERDEQAVGAELDVRRHQPGVHADEVDGERIADELLLDADRLGDDRGQRLVGELVDEERIEEAGKVGVEAC
jgi:hypothetical protein